MVIYNFHIEGVVVTPTEADAPLVVDTYRVLSGPIALQLLQAIGWRHPQIIKTHRSMKHAELSQRRPLKLLITEPYREYITLNV